VGIPARTSLVTLGVADVERAAEFYERLGWSRSPASVPGVVAFFATTGAVVALWGWAELAADAGYPAVGGPPAFRGVALAVNLGSEAEVDEALNAALAAGGTLRKAGTRADWGGYSGYFADPDGHLWEVAYNPGWPLDDDGRVVLP
jgi:catechol 2,3-dioxygenase-like lactoylglutathione lyase family enzyme